MGIKNDLIYHKLKFLRKTKTTKQKTDFQIILEYKFAKKLFQIIACTAIIITILVFFYSAIIISEVTSHEFNLQKNDEFLIQTLRGDTIDTWASWKLIDEDILNVVIKNSDVSQEKIAIIKNAVLSNEEKILDDSLFHKGPKGESSKYYLGWKGALDSISLVDTEWFIPNNFKVIESKKEFGDIIIQLSNLKDGDGKSGYTKLMIDDNRNQILKAYIVIYETDSLSNEELATVIRHEMGHALGLAHSTAPEDLMHPTFQTKYSYISECDINAIVSLYDGNHSSQIVCEK